MDPAYEDLERDIVEEYGAGRVWQEMAKSDYSKRGPQPKEGIHPNRLKHKKRKTKTAIDAEITQVLRKEEEQQGSSSSKERG